MYISQCIHMYNCCKLIQFIKKDTMAQSKHSHYPHSEREEWGYRKEGWDQNARLKPIRANTKCCSSSVRYCEHAAVWYELQVLEHPHPCSLASFSPHGLSTGLTVLTACSRTQQTVHMLAPLTSWSLHCIFSFIVTASHFALSGASCRESDPITRCLASLIFLWNLGGIFHNSCILHAWKTSTT